MVLGGGPAHGSNLGAWVMHAAGEDVGLMGVCYHQQAALQPGTCQVCV